MTEPDFSEMQLQQVFNIKLHEHYQSLGYLAFPHIPSLFREFELGYDTGVEFLWNHLPPGARRNEAGLSLFFQFKLSTLLESNRAKQWNVWEQAYLRFKIPHVNNNQDDYHQWLAMKDLGNNGFPAYYATNSMTSLTELRESYYDNSLLDKIPLLDVRDIEQHKFITFTSDSEDFALHSEVTKTPKKLIKSVYESGEALPLGDAMKRLLLYLQQVESDDMWRLTLKKIETRAQRTRTDSDSLKAWILQAMLRSFLLVNLGVDMVWLPKER